MVLGLVEHVSATILYLGLVHVVFLLARRERMTGWWLIWSACGVAFLRELMITRAIWRGTHIEFEAAVSAAPLIIAFLALAGYWMLYLKKNGFETAVVPKKGGQDHMKRFALLALFALLLPGCGSLFGSTADLQPTVDSITSMGAIQTATTESFRKAVEASALTQTEKAAVIRNLDRDETDYRRFQVEVLQKLATIGEVNWEEMVRKGFSLYDERKAKK